MHSTQTESLRTLLIVGAVVTVVGALVMGGQWLSSAPQTTMDINVRTAAQDEGYTEAPDFERASMDGSMLRLSSFRGRVVVLNFWATWCTPCRVEIPEFIEMQQQMHGVQFVGVSLDEEGFDVVRPYAEEMGITYPLVIGDDSLAADFGGVMGLPTTYVIDREGRIRQRFVGMVNEATLRPILAGLLTE